MTRQVHDFTKRSPEEQEWFRTNTYCEVCEQPDLGMVSPIEYMDAGHVFIEGKCSQCGAVVQSEISKSQS